MSHNTCMLSWPGLQADVLWSMTLAAMCAGAAEIAAAMPLTGQPHAALITYGFACCSSIVLLFTRYRRAVSLMSCAVQLLVIMLPAAQGLHVSSVSVCNTAA